MNKQELTETGELIFAMLPPENQSGLMRINGLLFESKDEIRTDILHSFITGYTYALIDGELITMNEKDSLLAYVTTVNIAEALKT